VGEPFEPEEATTIQVRRPIAPLARKLVVLALALWVGGGSYSVPEAVRNIHRWWAEGHRDAYPLFNTTSLAIHLFAYALAAALVIGWLRRRRRRPSTVRAEERGLLAEDVLVVAREDVGSVEVTTDADLGFATVVHARSGDAYVVPLRTERSARALAAALSPDHDAHRLVFDGVSGARGRETVVAVLAAAALLAAAAASPAIGLVQETIGTLLERYGHQQFSPAYWVEWLQAFASFFLGALASLRLTAPIVRRLQRGRVVVHGAGVTVGTREIARDAIARVDSDEGSAVALTLKDGTAIRAAFAADRPLVERDLFVARVRELYEGAPSPAYPSAETSGVRVALSPAAADATHAVDDEAVAEDESARDAGPQPRARRRG
jgi:hypothetical protein